MDKVALKAKLLKDHQASLDELKEEYAGYQRGGDLNLEDVRDADDNSHREQTEEYLYALERQIRQREEEISKLKSLDFSPKSAVTEGAVALVGGQYYIIGIPACQFDFLDKHFVAMSPEAPFYQELMDRKAADTFMFQGEEYRVDSIF